MHLGMVQVLEPWLRGLQTALKDCLILSGLCCLLEWTRRGRLQIESRNLSNIRSPGEMEPVLSAYLILFTKHGFGGLSAACAILFLWFLCSCGVDCI